MDAGSNGLLFDPSRLDGRLFAPTTGAVPENLPRFYRPLCNEIRKNDRLKSARPPREREIKSGLVYVKREENIGRVSKKSSMILETT